MNNDNIDVSSKDLNIDDRIATFLRGEMTADEEKAFKAELAKADKLRQKAVAMAHLVKATNAVGEERDEKVKEALTSVSKEQVEDIIESDREVASVRLKAKAERSPIAYESAPYQSAAQGRSHHSMIKFLSVAATILILVVCGYQYYDYRETIGLGNEYANSFVEGQQATYRGVESEDDKAMTQELKQLFSNVQQGNDLDKTTKRLSFLWRVSTMKYYNAYTDYAPLIGWNLAIADLKNNDRDAAKEVLTSLAAKNYSYSMTEKANELLKKLE